MEKATKIFELYSSQNETECILNFMLGSFPPPKYNKAVKITCLLIFSVPSAQFCNKAPLADEINMDPPTSKK